MKIEVEVFPVPGTKICLDGQAYEFLRIRFYQNGDGEVREIAYWRSICAEPGCAEPIEVFAPVGSVGLTRRCPEHRERGVRVSLVRSRRGHGGGRPRHFLRQPRAPESGGP